jgi:hypothetical protein
LYCRANNPMLADKTSAYHTAMIPVGMAGIF